MTSSTFSLIFICALSLNTALHAWLSWRQLHHVQGHRDAVPTDFSARITLAEHQKAADYSSAKSRLALLDLGIDTLMLLIFTFGGLLHALITLCEQTFPAASAPYFNGLMLIGSIITVGYFAHLPSDLYRTFVLEEKFGFNKLTPALYLIDLIKKTVLSIIIGAPLLLAVLWLMHKMGQYWWLYVWAFWMGFNLLALLLYPTLIAPLFNKFIPLDNPELKTRIEALLARCGFQSSGLFVMDGSKRSSHGNAYFTGFGAAKRIVFYDTLIERLTPPEIDAVLAHELGHYRHRHVIKRFVLLGFLTLLFFAILGALIAQPWFYAGLGLTPPAAESIMAPSNTALALMLFFLVIPSFTFPLSPLLSQLSRRHEYEADAYAARQTAASDLISSLAKLYRDNASTLTPDPLHSLFHDSHPPASLRVAHLKTLMS